jgi:hypothetical protein
MSALKYFIAGELREFDRARQEAGLEEASSIRAAQSSRRGCPYLPQMQGKIGAMIGDAASRIHCYRHFVNNLNNSGFQCVPAPRTCHGAAIGRARAPSDSPAIRAAFEIETPLPIT